MLKLCEDKVSNCVLILSNYAQIIIIMCLALVILSFDSSIITIIIKPSYFLTPSSRIGYATEEALFISAQLFMRKDGVNQCLD